MLHLIHRSLYTLSQRPVLHVSNTLCDGFTCGVHADRSGTDAEVHQLTIIVTAMLGFASYKVAVIAAALAPAPASSTVQRSTSAKQM